MQSISWFNRFAQWVSHLAGLPTAFVAAVLLILGWALTGPFFGFSDTWQLTINTTAALVTFLMVFVIQNTQNRNTAAIQVKLNELIRVAEGAHNALLDLEHLDVRDLDRIRTEYERLAERARLQVERGGTDVDTPEVNHPKPAVPKAPPNPLHPPRRER